MTKEIDIDSESEPFEIVGMARQYEVSVIYVTQDEDGTEEESDGVVYTLPAVSQRMAEEYAGLRFTMESQDLEENGRLLFETVCKDADHSLGADYLAEMLDVMSFYIKHGLSNESVVEALQIAVEEMQKSE